MGTFVQHPRCPYCHEPVQPHERKAACNGCMCWHHQECWDADSQCAACGAEQAVGVAEGAPPEAAQPEPATEGQQRPKKEHQPRVPMPSGIVMDDQGSQLVLKRRWFQASVFCLAFFCILWDGFLCVWYAAASNAAMEGGAPGIVMFVFPLIHVAVGVVLTYSVMATFLNTTVITVDRGTLTVKHGPLPWPGNLTINASRLGQLYCKDKVHRGKNNVSYTYELHALDREGSSKKLVSGLQKPEQVRFLEQEIERWLGIEDETVSGEMR